MHDTLTPLDNPASKNPGTQRYRPLESVWYGEEDAGLIEELLSFYPRREPRLILDATVNGGRFWRGSTRPVIGLDIDGRHRPHVCADNSAMPFRPGIFDVVIYDPPHIPNQGRDRAKDFNTRFGLGARSEKENGYNFAHTILPSWQRHGPSSPKKASCCARLRTMSTIIATNGLTSIW